ncbi:MAG: right-handed parallel beta-helix repeat-containing protein [Planctomycetaceae bacterium]|nr:right-handed parallel beta-helix repeat-containing protein [Planctomycetaceae bacterium]
MLANRTGRIITLGLLTAALGLVMLADFSDAQPESNELPALVGDGVHDDTAALQARISATAGPLTLPPGRYRLTAPLVVDLEQAGPFVLSGQGATLVMTAPGPAVRVSGTHFKSADPQNYAPQIWERERMPLIDGLAITAEHAEADGIEAVGTMQLTISRCHIRKCWHAIRLVENNRNVIISDCHLYENSGCGVFYDNVNLHQSNITGCHISYNGGGGVVSLKGNVRNIHIAGCDIESNMTPDQPPTANVLIDCRGSAYGTAEVAITGCTIQHNNPSPDSANIRIIGRSDPSPKQELVREGNVTIAGNVLSDVQVNIHLQDCRGVAITGNTLWQGYRHNLLLENCSSLVLAGNNLDRNPRYDYGNTAEANNSVVIRDCEGCTISGLHITNVWRDPAGLLIENCRRMHVSGCTVLDCDNRGVWLKNVDDSSIHDLFVRDDRPDSKTVSLQLTGGTGTVVRDLDLQTPLRRE